jgi:hypothetical protein
MCQPLRRALSVIVCCAALLAPRAAGADDPEKPAQKATSPADDAALDKLVRQLSDDDWKVREKAQQDLGRFGAGAVPRLQAELKGAKDPDLRARLEGAIKQIEENDATGPTFVTLHLKDAAPAEAFDELARQAGAKLATEPPGLLQRDDLPRVTLDAERQPFWIVMRQLCGTCRVRPERSGEKKLALAADDGSWARRPFVTSGPFLVTANELYVTRGIRFGAEPPAEAKPPKAPPAPPGMAGRDEGVADHAQLQVEAWFEPKLHGMSWSVGNVVEATDDAGRSMLLPRGAEPRRRATYGGSRYYGEWESVVWLAVPPNDRPHSKLTRLKFLSSFSVQTGVERIEVPNVLTAKDVEHVAGPARLVVKGVTRLGNDQYELSVGSYPVSDVQAWRGVQAGQFRRGPRLLSDDGRELSQAGGSSSMSDREYASQLRFMADRGKEPAKLVWDVPTGVQQYAVPVEFVDLPVP